MTAIEILHVSLAALETSSLLAAVTVAVEEITDAEERDALDRIDYDARDCYWDQRIAEAKDAS